MTTHILIQLDSRLGFNVEVGKMDDHYSHQIGPCLQFVHLNMKRDMTITKINKYTFDVLYQRLVGLNPRNSYKN